ncbi:hypothetical protein FYM52_02015 [Comamonas sp. CAH-2]|uniref:major capsid protein n=1 Tax=Comamonas sp. CAH-2 TaxID=2605745 RepID=UPI0012AE8CC9|nr:major capsid protein [Comamonas sp. CAH-2]MRT19140.1 hypothetical protein [Comamonas sp. CAH-2]
MFKNRINAARALLGAGALAVGSAVHAELPAAAGTAITAYETDALQALGLVMAAGVAVWGLMKLMSKLGWR